MKNRSTITVLAAGAAIAFLVFGGRRVRPRAFFIPFALYFGVSMAVGGVMSGVGALLSHLDLPALGGSDLSFPAFLALALFGGVATFLWGKLCRRRAGVARARLRLVVGDKEVSVLAFADSGDLLADPIGGKPVVLLDAKAALSIFPREAVEAAKSGDFSLIGKNEAAWSRRVRLIPAGSIAGKTMLLAFSPDRAYLDAGRGEVPCDILVAPTALSLQDGDEALIPSELIVK